MAENQFGAGSQPGNWLAASNDLQINSASGAENQIGTPASAYQFDYLSLRDAQLDWARSSPLGQQAPIVEDADEAFYFGDPVNSSPQQLLDERVFEVDENWLVQGTKFRPANKVLNIQIRQAPLDENEKGEFMRKHADFYIDGKHDAIRLIHNPDTYSDRKIGNSQANANNTIVIALENVWAKERPVGMTDEQWAIEKEKQLEKEKAQLRDVLYWIHNRYVKAMVRDFLPAEIYDALTKEIKIPGEPEYGDGKSGHRLYWENSKFIHRKQPHPRKFENISKGAERENTCGNLRRLSELSEVERSHFIKDLVNVLSANEGPDSYKSHPKDKNGEWAEDNGSGISVGRAQWNQEKGELPDLLREWHKRDKNAFERIFHFVDKHGKEHNYVDLLTNPARETELRKTDFLKNGTNAHTNPFLKAMEEALDFQAFKDVQDELLEKKAERAIKLADKYGHDSLRFIAQVLDVANQKGWTGCEQRMRNADVAAIPNDARGECTAIKALERASADRAGNDRRNKRLDEMFAKDRTAMQQAPLRKPANNLSQTA